MIKGAIPVCIDSKDIVFDAMVVDSKCLNGLAFSKQDLAEAIKAAFTAGQENFIGTDFGDETIQTADDYLRELGLEETKS